MKTLYNKMGHGGRMKYAGGGRMSNSRLARMLAKYMMGGKMKMEHGGKHYGHGGAHDSSGQPILNPFDDSDMARRQRQQQERSMIDEGLLSSATPGGGATIAFGEGSPVDFETVRERYIENNPDIVNPSKRFYMVGDERVFFDRGDDAAMDKLVLQPALDRGVDQGPGSTSMSIYNDLLKEFDDYVAGFGDELKNDPGQIKRMRRQFMNDAMNYASQVEDLRMDYARNR